MDMKKAVAKLNKKVSKWSKDWVENETVIEMFRDDPYKNFQSYVDSEYNVKLLSLRAEEFHLWHFVHYMNGLLNERKDSLEEIGLAARYAIAKVRFEEAFANAEQGGSLLIDESVFVLSLSILSSWKDTASNIGTILNKGLNTSLLDLRHTDKHEAGKVYRHFWFLMHIFNDYENRSIDTSLYSYPEDMSPYADVLADWRTEDLDKVQKFVSDMADFHIKEARTTAHDEIAEFDEEDVMIFPYEILTFLRLREWSGLKNPERFNHPLMNQPLAILPSPVPLPKPETPLLDQVIEKFRKDYPGSFMNWQ